MYPGLDTIRAIAATSVVATHVAFFSGYYGTGGFLGTASARLDIGVAIFFVLSGFLLSSQFLKQVATGEGVSGVRRYLYKRALRILPLYWVAVVFAMTLLPENAGADITTWLRNLTLTQIYWSAGPSQGLTQMWSLSTEVAFYLILPLFALVIAQITRHRGWKVRPIIFILAFAAATNIIWSYLVAPLSSNMGLWLPAYLTWFGAGILLAVVKIDLNSSVNRYPLLWQLGQQPGTAWAIALSLFAVASTPIAGPVLLIPPDGSQAVTKNLLYAVISFLIVLPSVLGSETDSRYNRIMGNRVLRHLGHISYGVFALHMIVLDFITPRFGYELFRGNGLEVFFIVLVVTLILAEISYRLLEEPILRLKDFSFGSRAKPASAPTQADEIH